MSADIALAVGGIGTRAGVGRDGHAVDGNGGLLRRAEGVVAVLVLDGVHAGHGVHDVHALVDLAEHRVCVVQIRQPAYGGVGRDLGVGVAVGGQLSLLVSGTDTVRQSGHKIKLAVAAGHVAARSKCRTECPGVVLQIGVGFQRVGVVAPDRGTASACAGLIFSFSNKNEKIITKNGDILFSIDASDSTR